MKPMPTEPVHPLETLGEPFSLPKTLALLTVFLVPLAIALAVLLA